MAKWIWDKTKAALIPAERFHVVRGTGPAINFMPDIKPFRSPLDGSEISSRSSLRVHERRHGVRQCGELKSAADFDNRKLRSYRSLLSD